MNDKLLSLKILSPDRIILNLDKIASINVRLENGSLIGVRPGHAPLIALSADSLLSYRSEDTLHKVHVNDGILTIENNKVMILTTGPK